eukprot:TRINITY_DN14331_c0_g4_i1.p1 TRINITY_DN14331_c0_g4~~TRINITY_DN14331_c0_g4_i1.p1  ORF type:complete len:521 (+),score=118.95 TRINITY_DN14331_c0_g4_i1:106-1668(+)
MWFNIVLLLLLAVLRLGVIEALSTSAATSLLSRQHHHGGHRHHDRNRHRHRHRHWHHRGDDDDDDSLKFVGLDDVDVDRMKADVSGSDGNDAASAEGKEEEDSARETKGEVSGDEEQKQAEKQTEKQSQKQTENQTEKKEQKKAQKQLSALAEATKTLHHLSTQSDHKAKSASSNSEQKDLDALERSLMEVIQAGRSPQAQAFGGQVQIMVNTLRANIMEQFVLMNKTLNDTKRARSSCVMQTSPVQNFRLPEFEDQHRACRRAQADANGVAKEARDKADHLQTAVDRNCKDESGGPDFPSDKQCDYNETRYADDGSEKVLKYYEDQLKFWAGIMEDAGRRDEECRNATRDFTPADQNASDAEARALEFQNNCSKYQKDMDKQSCKYKASYDANCSRYSDCFADWLKQYNSTWAHALQLQESLQSQMSSVVRIECYLRADNSTATDVAIEMRACSETDHRNSTEVRALAYKELNPMPAPDNCKEAFPDEHVAGSYEYAQKYYANCSNLIDACVAECCNTR